MLGLGMNNLAQKDGKNSGGDMQLQSHNHSLHMALPALLIPAHYTNWMPFEARETSSGFSIACRRTPRGAISLHAGLIAIVFCGFSWLTYTKAPEWFWATVALGTLTLGGFLTSVIWFHQSQQRRGPVLVYEKNSATFGLPRESRTFRANEVDCICLVDGHAAEDAVCQLQLHSLSGDPILLASGYYGSLDQIFNTIASSVPVTARRCTQGQKA
jgi:hypothetical protein